MIRLFFGSPGCGKTTTGVQLLKKEQNKKRPKYDYYFSNFDNDLSKKVSLKGLGDWSFPEYSYLLVDEAGIEYNNRKFKSLPQSTIAYFKLHRHYKVDIDFISQSWEDTDVTIRRLADEYWYIRRLGPISVVRRVYRKVDVDDQTHQIIDSYKFGKMIKRFLPFPFTQKTWFIVWRPKYYKYFNTHERPNIPTAYAEPQKFNRSQNKKPSLIGKGFRAAKQVIRTVYDRCVRKQNEEDNKNAD